MTRRTQIAIVDDHSLIRKGIIQVLSGRDDLAVAGEADNLSNALELFRTRHFDLAIIDLTLRESSGVQLIKETRRRFPNMRILVVSMEDEAIFKSRALKAGAHGYSEKKAPNSQFLTRIDEVLGLKEAEDPLEALVNESSDPQPLEVLSDREMEVFQAIGEGLSTRLIAERMHRSVKTVESFRARIKKKLDISDSNELMQRAVQWRCLRFGQQTGEDSTVLRIETARVA
ncbi:MAG: response regulator transcription factor [Lacipirellulaceae bacterium]